jgi:hypothetical protein
MATPTYRTVNITATLLGIDRRLSIVILLLSFLVFRHVSFVAALAASACSGRWRTGSPNTTFN